MKKSWLKKFSLLSISLVLTSAGAISGNIPAMTEAFADESVSSVEMLMTIPALFMVIFVLFSSFISKRIGQKRTVILGLIIALISGVIPAFSKNFIIILISRATLGAGLGLFNPLAISMISDFFDGDERARLIGFQSAFQGVGTAIMTYVAGQLLKINWHTTFWVYAIILPILILFILFVPEPKKIHIKVDNSNQNKNKQSINLKVIGYIILIFIVMIIYTGAQVKAALLFTSNSYGSATDAASMISIMSIGSMLAGFIFGSVLKVIRHYMTALSIFLMGGSFSLLAISKNIFISNISGALIGISFSLLLPYLLNQIAIVSSEGSATLSTSLLLVGANLGSSFSPYGLAVLGYLSGVKTVNGIFMAGGIVLVTIAVIELVITFLKDEKKVINK